MSDIDGQPVDWEKFGEECSALAAMASMSLDDDPGPADGCGKRLH